MNDSRDFSDVESDEEFFENATLIGRKSKFCVVREGDSGEA
jgi:hypothetical protein